MVRRGSDSAVLARHLLAQYGQWAADQLAGPNGCWLGAAITTLPPRFGHADRPAGIAIYSDGTSLYVSNRARARSSSSTAAARARSRRRRAPRVASPTSATASAACARRATRWSGPQRDDHRAGDRDLYVALRRVASRLTTVTALQIGPSDGVLSQLGECGHVAVGLRAQVDESLGRRCAVGHGPRRRQALGRSAPTVTLVYVASTSPGNSLTALDARSESHRRGSLHAGGLGRRLSSRPAWTGCSARLAELTGSDQRDRARARAAAALCVAIFGNSRVVTFEPFAAPQALRDRRRRRLRVQRRRGLRLRHRALARCIPSGHDRDRRRRGRLRRRDEPGAVLELDRATDASASPLAAISAVSAVTGTVTATGCSGFSGLRGASGLAFLARRPPRLRRGRRPRDQHCAADHRLQARFERPAVRRRLGDGPRGLGIPAPLPCSDRGRRRADVRGDATADARHPRRRSISGAGTIVYAAPQGQNGTTTFTFKARYTSFGTFECDRVDHGQRGRCSAAAARPGLTTDHDGFFAGQDCNDTNAAIRPGAIEIKGNQIDENCDGLAEPFPTLTVGCGAQAGTVKRQRRSR